jgi:hypothetical protein
VGVVPPLPRNFQVYELTRCISQLVSPTALEDVLKVSADYTKSQNRNWVNEILQHGKHITPRNE